MHHSIMHFKTIIHNHFFSLGLLLFLIVGLALRVQPILKTSMWDDEAISINIAKNTLPFDLVLQKDSYWDMVHPSLYYIILRQLLLISDHEYVLRGFSVLFFPLSFLTIFHLIKTQPKTAKLAILALYSIHPMIVRLEYQVRMYSIALFANLTSLLVIRKYLKEGGKLNLTLSVISLSLSLYLDYLTIWLILALMCYTSSLLRHSKIAELKKLINVLVGTFILSFYQIQILLRALAENRFNPGSVTKLADFPFLLTQLFELTGFNHYFDNFLGIYIILGLFVFISVSKLKLWKIVALAPLIVVIFTSIFITPLFVARNLIITTVASLIVLGIEISHKNGIYKILFICYCCLLFINSATMSKFDYSRKNFSILHQIKRDNLNVILVGENDFEPFLMHYFPQNNIATEHYYRPSTPNEVTPVSGQKILVLVANICQSQQNCTKIFNTVTSMCEFNECDFQFY